MRKIQWYSLAIILIVMIPITTYLDTLIFGGFTLERYIEYLAKCSWEFGIFLLGAIAGIFLIKDFNNQGGS